MVQNCFVCNSEVGVTQKLISYILKDCGTILGGVLSEILERDIADEIFETKTICQTCRDACIEYNRIKQRLKSIREDLSRKFNNIVAKQHVAGSTASKTITLDDLSSKFKNTTSKQNTATYTTASTTRSGNTTASNTTASNTAKTPTKCVVLQASKLQPVPADYVLKNLPFSHFGSFKTSGNLNLPTSPSKVSQDTTTNNIFGKSYTDVTITKIAPSVASSAANSDKSSIFSTDIKFNNTSDALNVTGLNSSLASGLVLTTTAGDVKLISSASNMLDMNVLPKEFFSSIEGEKMKQEENDEGNTEELEMEIDEDCTVRVIKENPSKGTDNFKNDDKLDSDDETEFGEELVLGELEVMSDNGQDDDDATERLIVSESNGARVRIVRGRHVVYNAEELALVDDDTTQHNESNDESQIELQVSGDEETANAIIQAAQEQGGAFIKVESGEMFRVKSVKSAEIKAELDEKQKIVEKVGDKFKCLLCKEKSDESPQKEWDAQGTMQHVRSCHSARVYICAVCGHVMDRRQLYTAHMAEHSASVAAITRGANSRTNGRTKGSTGTHTCGTCKKTFVSKYTLLAHLKTHEERPRPFKCEKCPKSFLTMQNLNQHLKTHSGVKDFICKTCGKAFGSQHNLEMHSVVHSGQKPFACTTCGKCFARRAELQDHNRTHTGERPFVCGDCGACFAQRSNLHSHRRAAHLRLAPHPCSLCPKKFKRRRLLEYHIKSCHTGERPLRCKVCHASFVYPEHYKKHLRIHSGERPYTCEVCGKAFNSRDIRNTHRFVHSDKKPYECVVCGAGFMRRPHLYTHMNNAGHIAESIVVNQPRIQVTENVAPDPTVEIRSDKFDALFNSVQEVELISSQLGSDGATLPIRDMPKLYLTNDKKLILQDGKSTMNLVEDCEGSREASDMSALLNTISVEQLAERAQVIFTEDEDPSITEGGGVVRMVPIKLDDGNTGWLAISE